SDRTLVLISAGSGGAERGPARAGHGVHPHDAVVVRIRHVDLPSADEDAEWSVELAHAAAGGRSAERGPPRACHIVHPHDAVVARVRHEDLPRGADVDATREFKLVHTAAEHTERGTPRTGRCLHPHAPP